MKNRKVLLASAVLCLAFAAAVLAANKFTEPKSVLHIVTVQWKEDSTPEQQNAAIEGVRKMAGEVPGMTRIWLKKLKVQPSNYSTLFVMEFKDEAAFKAYENHPAHREWEKVYVPVRQRSTTHDVTN